jgi:hypothetical protein
MYLLQNVMHHHAKGGCWLLVFEGESIGQFCFFKHPFNNIGYKD